MPSPVATDGIDYASNEQCVFTTPYNAGHSAHFGVMGGTDAYGNSVGKHRGGFSERHAGWVNYFKNPVAVWNQVRAPILGIDTRNPGLGPFTGQPYWNMDGQVKKDVRITESTSFEFSFIATNMLNHRQFTDAGGTGGVSLATPATWGVLNSQANPPRQMEFGGRLTF